MLAGQHVDDALGTARDVFIGKGYAHAVLTPATIRCASHKDRSSLSVVYQKMGRHLPVGIPGLTGQLQNHPFVRPV